MTQRRTQRLLAVIGIAALIAAALYYTHVWRARTSAPASATQQAKVLYWYDPMHPQQHFDKPGKSPFMDMELVPKYAQESAKAPATPANIDFDARHLQKLGLRLAPVERAAFGASVGAVGSIAFNERDTIVLQARSAGFVQRVYDRAVGDIVERGAPLVDLVVPEWLGAQQEILALQKAGDDALLAAARARALALGMPAGTLAQIERTRRPQSAFTVVAPRAGAIKSLDVRAGMTVAAGAPIATINGIERVWLDVAVAPAAAQALAVGDRIEASFAALPPQRGTIVAILPESDSATRTLRVRAELNNPQRNLRPGLLAQVQFENLQAAPALSVPSAAIIRGGRGDRVIVAEPDGGFHPVRVTVGREEGDRSEIVDGVEEGQQVVASGQFLIDSEANLSGQLERIESAEPAPASADEHGHHEETQP